MNVVLVLGLLAGLCAGDANLAACQESCNKVDIKTYSEQIKGTCASVTGGSPAIEQCGKGFKLGVSIGCDFVCTAGGSRSVPPVSSEPVRAARAASCPARLSDSLREACNSGFDAGVGAYFDNAGAGGGFLWPLFKLLVILYGIFYGACRYKHHLPPPVQQSLYRIEKVVKPAERAAAKHAGTALKAALAHAEKLRGMYEARKAAAGANPAGLPGALPPFGSLDVLERDILGGKLHTSNEFPQGLAEEVARAFARAYTNEGGGGGTSTVTLMTRQLAAQRGSAAPLRSQTLVTGGFSKTVCDEVVREFVGVVGGLLEQAGCDSYDIGVYGKLVKCLTPNAGAKLLREHGCLNHRAISNVAADDADGRDRELGERHLMQLHHTIAVGTMSGKPSVHVISNAFVGDGSEGGEGASSAFRVKMVSSNLLQATGSNRDRVCKMNYVVKKTSFKSMVEAVSENLSELHAAVEHGRWGQYLSADSERAIGGAKDSGV